MAKINIMSGTKYNSNGSNIQDKIMSRFSMFQGVGIDLSKTKSYDEALTKGELDYTANKSAIFLEDGTMIKNNFAMVKSDDSTEVLGITGKQYTAVSNRDAFSVAEEIVNEGHCRYERGGPSVGSQNVTDYARSFLVLRGDDFSIGEDDYNSFVVFNNSFDGSSGVIYQVICQRVVCLNGMVRMLGGKKNQLRVNIQHSKTAHQKIEAASVILKKRQEDIELIKKEAEAFSLKKYTRTQFEKEIIPFVLKHKKLVENDKERERGAERVEEFVKQVLMAYDAPDTQNYNGTARKVILALSDWETHYTPMRDTGNPQIYFSRIMKGMETTTAVAQYLANTLSIGV